MVREVSAAMVEVKNLGNCGSNMPSGVPGSTMQPSSSSSRPARSTATRHCGSSR
jgi:hypothetical protein